MRCTHVLLALGLPVLLSACGGGGGSGDDRVAAISLPSYGTGDSYTFDDGTVLSVTGTANDEVFWHTNRGVNLVTTRDVLLPPVEENAPGMTLRQQVVTSDLFPLDPGKHATFAAMLQPFTGGQDTPRETGECRVGGNSTITTPAGTFDTVRVACTLQHAGDEVPLRRTYFYAPAIAYYVQRDDRTGDGPTHTITLAHYETGNPILPGTAMLRRTDAIQRALERQISDAHVAWQDPVTGASGAIEPVLTEHSPQFGWCREFREQISVTARDYDLLGTACRGRDGTWLVKEITPFRAAS